MAKVAAQGCLRHFRGQTPTIPNDFNAALDGGS